MFLLEVVAVDGAWLELSDGWSYKVGRDFCEEDDLVWVQTDEDTGEIWLRLPGSWTCEAWAALCGVAT